MAADTARLHVDGRGLTNSEPSWVDRKGAPAPIDPTWREASVNNVALSPDGKWLAYVSNESGIAQIYDGG